MAMAAASPTARVSVATAMITNIRIKVRIASKIRPGTVPLIGWVAPKLAASPINQRTARLPSIAPHVWATQ